MTLRCPSFFVLLATLLGFALRMPLLGDVPPRWDEGWSIAHASLSLNEIFTITSADVHPPLYYVVLGVWQQVTGVNPAGTYSLFAARYLSVLLSTTAVPLAYVAAKVWSRSDRIAIPSALFIAWLPLGVYYGGVVRMYALAPSFVLLASYAALCIMYCVEPRRKTQDARRNTVLFVIGATGAMLTLYHAVWALGAIALYAFVISRQRIVVRRMVLAIALSIVCYMPWAIYAVPQFFGRAVAQSATNIAQQYPITYFIRQGLYDLTMSQQVGDWGLIVTGAILIGALIAGFSRRGPLMRLLLPTLIISFTLVGVAFAARQWAFNARMLICAVPALAFALGWAFDQLLTQDARRKTRGIFCLSSSVLRLLATLVAFALLGIYFTTSLDFVYGKTLEVFDPYNPRTYHQHVAPKALPNDLVFFNVLSPAGFYALHRDANDPRWSYALTWDPVIEPRQRWEERINEASQNHSRVWLVLYRGLAGKNGDLHGWMDLNFYPAYSEWGEEEVFYGLYGAPRHLEKGLGSGTRWGNVQLRDVRVGASVTAGEVIPVALTWRALEPVAKNYKVFVHAIAPDGRLIAQHDAQPLNDLRPMMTWPTDEDVNDNHGLALPQDYQGELQIQLGLYDPDTGVRLRTDDNDAVIVGQVTVNPWPTR